MSSFTVHDVILYALLQFIYKFPCSFLVAKNVLFVKMEDSLFYFCVVVYLFKFLKNDYVGVTVYTPIGSSSWLICIQLNLHGHLKFT